MYSLVCMVTGFIGQYYVTKAWFTLGLNQHIEEVGYVSQSSIQSSEFTQTWSRLGSGLRI